jgi:small subunit ribosomal protein S21
MKLARWLRGMAEEGAEVSGAAVIEASEAADASDGRRLQPRFQASNLINAIEDGRKNQMAHIQIHEGESIENALRRFKRKVLQEDIIKEAKKHAFYLKPGEKKRVKQALARKRARKKVRRQPNEDR